MSLEVVDANGTIAIFIKSCPIWLVCEIDVIELSFTITLSANCFPVGARIKLYDLNISTFKGSNGLKLLWLVVWLDGSLDVFNVALAAAKLAFHDEVCLAATPLYSFLLNQIEVYIPFVFFITGRAFDLEMPLIIRFQVQIV